MEADRARRRLAAIVAADVAGYSRLVGGDEEGTLTRLKALIRDLIEPRLARHTGRIVKTTGDGLLMEFGSTVDAVRCVLDLQRAVIVNQESVPENRRIRFRIGIHVGDVVVDGEDILGDGVNVASRLEQLAEPGGVCVSGRAVEDVRGRMELDLQDIGDQSLKNIERPVRVFRLAVQPSGLAQTVLALPDRPSIAVLPFQNMSGDPEQDYFADGMVEEIITALSRFQRLFVIARNSSFTYKGRSVDVKHVARELGVRYVLEGSVRKANNRVRITGQLIDALSGAHLWADKFDGDLEDVFELQDKVALTVVGIIEPRIRAAEIARAGRKPVDNLDAYDLYLRAVGLADTPNRSREGHAAALKLLYRAIELSPTYALATARAAMIFVGRWSQGWVEDIHGEPLEAIRLARASLTADLDNSDAAYFAGFSLIFFATDVDRALQLIDRSLSINSNCARAWLFSGGARVYLGDYDRAIAHLLLGKRMDPFDPLRYWTATYLSFAHHFCERYDESLALARQAVNESPTNSSGLRLLAANHAALGNMAEARQAAQVALETDPRYVERHRLNRPYAFVQSPGYGLYRENLWKAGIPR